jgi:hypothetical protein
MTKKQPRIELLIDVFDQPRQRAQVLPQLTPLELIDSILQEFRELEYLGSRPEQYELRRTDGFDLVEEQPVQEQLKNGAHLVLAEKERPLPPKAQRPQHAIYLRDPLGRRVYKLHWLPAIIGRTAPQAGDKGEGGELLAVNLAPHANGLRVSRRHAKITASGRHYYIECLADNPTFLRRNVLTIEVKGERQPLQHGDVIVLERSHIELKFLVRPLDSGGLDAGDEEDEVEEVEDGAILEGALEASVINAAPDELDSDELEGGLQAQDLPGGEGK